MATTMPLKDMETTSQPATIPNGFSLENILGDGYEWIDHPENPVLKESAVGWDEEAIEEPAETDGFCIECEDQPTRLFCETCLDNYCEVCFAALHRKGTRKSHVAKHLREQPKVNEEPVHEIVYAAPEAEDMTGPQSEPPDSHDVPGVGESYVERAKYIPLRLTLPERKYLRLLEAALQVSEYTDKIDIFGLSSSKTKRIVYQIRELCAILSGLVLSADYKQGQGLFSDRDFEANEEFYQQIFELGRRHKIMNPDKMRSTYGKLIYLLQDSQSPEVKGLLSFSCVRPITTVYSVLEEHDLLDLLRDDDIALATKEVYSESRSRPEIQRDIRRKERAIENLASRYGRGALTPEKIRQCLYSIGDNQAFLRANRDPCQRMIEYLKEHFNPTHAKDNKSSLAIRRGREGARLTHDHAAQYAFVLQSLTLWREILNDMFHLWYLAEQDLLSEKIAYRLRDTGQGLNRVQAAPKTSRMMHEILSKAQKSLGSWVGSSVIHMGDHNVPNALIFIDKYSQIYRILLPICNTLSQIPQLAEKPSLRLYIEQEFGSVENLMRDILCDFFRHGFDGSGADNFFDAGSCIDGRLTSAWNWCSLIEKKHYFHVFLLTGFTGFDGDW